MLHLMSVLEQEGPAFAERSLVTLMGVFCPASTLCDKVSYMAWSRITLPCNT